MGPDEDHPNVDNNGYTNAAAQLAIRLVENVEIKWKDMVILALKLKDITIRQGYPGNCGEKAFAEEFQTGGWRLQTVWSSNTTGVILVSI